MSVLTSPVTIGIVGILLGAGATALVLGTGDLQSPNAAAWASAIATFMAAVVALWVGLTPEMNRRRASNARASAALQWAESAIGTQLIHLGFALNLMESRYFRADEVEKLRRDLGVLDSASLRVLIDHVEGLDPNVAKLAWRCIIDVDRARQLAAGLALPPEGSIVDLGSDFADVFVDVFISMDEARRAFAMQVYGKFEAVATPQRVIDAQSLEQRTV